MNRKSIPFFFFGLLALYFLFLAYQVLHSDYLLTDDAWALWHMPDHHSVYEYWLRQGRLFTGIFESRLFDGAHTVASLKSIRLLSLVGWVACTALLYFVLKRLNFLKDEIVVLATAYFATSFFALVFIGWAVCAEVFIPTLLSLAAGWILFKNYTKIWAAGLFLILGIAALFFYQTCYPLVLIPFYCLYLSRKDGRFTKPMLISLLCFFLGLGIYYFLFKISLDSASLPPNPRTTLKFNPFDRIGFFFAPPMNQAFNVNALFNMRSAMSQAVFPVVAAAWLGLEFFYRKGKTTTKLRYVLGTLLWWIFGYLPILISQETFGPYRSMPVLGLMVFLLLADLAMSLIKDTRSKPAFVYILVLIFLCWGGFVYYAYLAHPLREEYRAVREEVTRRFNPHIKEVIFIRPNEDGFLQHFGIRPYKDELGMPSTYKDWTPEPMVKQIVYEMTGNRGQAEALKVTSYEKAEQVPDKSILTHDDVLYVDTHTLF